MLIFFYNNGFVNLYSLKIIFKQKLTDTIIISSGSLFQDVHNLFQFEKMIRKGRFYKIWRLINKHFLLGVTIKEFTFYIHLEKFKIHDAIKI